MRTEFYSFRFFLYSMPPRSRFVTTLLSSSSRAASHHPPFVIYRESSVASILLLPYTLVSKEDCCVCSFSFIGFAFFVIVRPFFYFLRFISPCRVLPCHKSVTPSSYRAYSPPQLEGTLVPSLPLSLLIISPPFRSIPFALDLAFEKKREKIPPPKKQTNKQKESTFYFLCVVSYQ